MPSDEPSETTPATKEYPWEPLSGPQATALHSVADIIGYGGAAGGGKSDLLLGASLTTHSRSIIYRREGKQVRAIIERSHEIIGAAGSFNGSELIWRLADGRMIEFGGAANMQNARRYQGRPHDLVAFDEATEIPEPVYRFLIGWNRTTDPDQHCRVLLTFNPPTTDEGRWILRYFAPWIDPDYHGTPAAPGELVWYAVIDSKEVEVGRGDEQPADHPNAKSRTFIPARLEDNPHLQATGYAATLEAMPEPLRTQMRYGDFSVGLKDDIWQVIPRAWLKAAMDRWQPDGRAGQRCDTIGVDVARGGDDRTVIARRYGTWIADLEVYDGSDTPDGQSVAALVMQGYTDGATINVDVIGVGTSAYDHLADYGVSINAVNVAESSAGYDHATQTFRFANKRAEIYWRLREALDPVTGDNLAIPPDQELLAELCSVRYEVRASGIQIESKDRIRERLGRSPDKADALTLALMPNAFDFWAL